MVAHPSAAPQEGELSQVRGGPLGAEQCWPGSWGDAGKMKLFSLLFLYSYSQEFCSTVLLKLLKWIPKPWSLFLFLDSCLIIVLCGMTEAEVSCFIILVI